MFIRTWSFLVESDDIIAALISYHFLKRRRGKDILCCAVIPATVGPQLTQVSSSLTVVCSKRWFSGDAAASHFKLNCRLHSKLMIRRRSRPFKNTDHESFIVPTHLMVLCRQLDATCSTERGCDYVMHFNEHCDLQPWIYLIVGTSLTSAVKRKANIVFVFFVSSLWNIPCLLKLRHCAIYSPVQLPCTAQIGWTVPLLSNWIMKMIVIIAPICRCSTLHRTPGTEQTSCLEVTRSHLYVNRPPMLATILASISCPPWLSAR